MNLRTMQFGLIEQEDDVRDFTAETLGISSGDKNTTVELELPPFVYNQGNTDMCTAFASTMMMTMINSWTNEEGEVVFPAEFSQFDIYAQKSTSGEGAQLRDILNQLYKRGVAPNELYNGSGTFEDSKNAYMENKDKSDFMASLGRVRHYYKTESVEDVVAALELGKPLMSAVMIYDNFEPDNMNHIPLPQGDFLGGHCVLIVGHKPGYFKILNSWGDQWGVNGTSWIKCEMITLSYVPVDLNMKVKNVYFQIGTDFYVKNGEKHYMTGLDANGLEVPTTPFIKDGRTMIPLKYVADAVDGETVWYPKGKVIYIKL